SIASGSVTAAPSLVAVLARGDDPPEPPAGQRPRSFVTGPLALARGADPPEPPPIARAITGECPCRLLSYLGTGRIRGIACGHEKLSRVDSSDLPSTEQRGKLASTRLNFTTTKDYTWHVR